MWTNKLPNSPDLTRWLSATHQKETSHCINSKFKSLSKQIDILNKHDFLIESLSGKVYFLSGKKSQIVNVMYDGKSLTSLSKLQLKKEKLSFKDCHACLLSQNEFAENCFTKFEIPASILNLGIAPLHILLRSMEFCFYLAITLKVGKCSQKSQEFVAQKNVFKHKFKKELNLRLFEVDKDFGSSNVGNSCRKFFKEAEKTSEILELPIEILEAFHGLNTIISTTHELSNISEYRNLSSFLNFMLTQEPFSQKPLIPTVHRALSHFENYYDHFKHLNIPFGALSESALEARNKFTHKFREGLCFKGTLKKNLRDLGIRTLLSSDPLISLEIRHILKRKAV